MPSKRARECVEEPFQWEDAPLLLACFVNLTVSARHKAFKIPMGFRFRRKRRQARQPCSRPFIELVEPLQFIERHAGIRFSLKNFKDRFQLFPERPFTGNEAFQVENHRTVVVRLISSASV